MTTTRPLSLAYGSAVSYQGQRYIIRQESQDFATVTLYAPESGRVVQAPIVELSPLSDVPVTPAEDLATIDDEDWQEANRIYGIIKPLLEDPGRTKADVLKRAEECQVHYTSIYRWIQQFESIGKVSVFLRRERKDKGKKLLSEPVEKIVQEGGCQDFCV